jgi:hypothetical protein
MAFIPKNKYQKLYTNGESLVTLDGKPYIGPYIALSNNTFYAGKDINSIGEELKTITSSDNKIVNSRSINIFKALNPRYVSKELQYKTPVATKPAPTKMDYENGVMTRYFGYRIQTFQYFECDKKTYDEIVKGTFIDKSLYSFGKITWLLSGDTEKVNGANLIRLEQIFPKLRNLFPNLTEYTLTTENLTAKANELEYLDGTPFLEGSKYHLHPKKGPMEGKSHTTNPHKSLRFIDKEKQPTPVETPQTTTPIPAPITPTPTPTRRVSSTPSYGGGGGY